MKCRARDKQRQRAFEQKQVAQQKRRKEVANAAQEAKARLTAEAAREILSFAQQQQTVVFKPSLRLGAGTSREMPRGPQIVDYADAALETAKVIDSEQLKHAIIKATEYVPHILGIDSNSLRRTPSIRHMPIKYEKTLRGPASNTVSATAEMTPMSEYPKLACFLRDKKQNPGVVVNFRSTCAERVIAGKNHAGGEKNARKITKRIKGSTKANIRLSR